MHISWVQLHRFFIPLSFYKTHGVGVGATDSILRYALHNNFNILQYIHPN